jgi:soluble lytic murein transglycosylase
MHRAFRLLVLTLLVALLMPGLAFAAKHPAKKAAAPAPQTATQLYKKAFAELDAGHTDAAMAYAHGPDPVLNKVLRSTYMAQPGNDVSFGEMSEFIAQHPDWPNIKGISAIAEQKIPADATPQQVITWFTTHPPVSLAGFDRALSAFEAVGQTQGFGLLIRAHWIEGDFGSNDAIEFHTRFARFIDADADWERLDRLVWKGDQLHARQMYPLVSEAMRADAEARFALAAQSANADTLLDRVPSDMQNDPGLLYEKLHWDVRNNRDDEAISILNHAPQDLGKAEAWWDQRQVEIRRAMMLRDYGLAYKLASAHNQTESKTLTQGEFLAGWLALRFLNEPQEALPHFQTLYDNASTPVSRARGAYWLGRTYEALNQKANAEQAYENAAALDITYYGQLALTRLYPNPIIKATPEPPIPGNIRQAFFNRDSTRAIEHLHSIGESDRARSFFHAAVEAAYQRADFAMLIELAYQIQRPDLAIEAAKAANQKNMLIGTGGFPVLDHPLPGQPEPAFTHALIRQESMFNPNASSPAGAHGLMQLMPRTAQDIARKLGIKFKESELGNTDYNLRLGTTFIQNQLAIFSGSYVLALAGYNAGPGRVHEWMRVIGDPRDPNVDPIDWVEMIPVTETRNYVQRIIESLQVYRARLNGGQAPLLILNDLKR